MAPKLEKPSDLTAEEALQFQVWSFIDAFSGPFGKIVAGLIAEGQRLQSFVLRLGSRANPEI
jgi:hypothetical protein